MTMTITLRIWRRGAEAIHVTTAASGRGRRSSETTLVSRTAEQVVSQVERQARLLVVTGDIDHVRHLPAVFGDSLRAILLGATPEFAESLLRLLYLPTHADHHLSRQNPSSRV